MPRQRDLRHSVRRGIAHDDEPLAASLHVLPELPVHALGIVEQEDILVPRLEFRRAVLGPAFAGVPAVAKFGVLALPAERTFILNIAQCL